MPRLEIRGGSLQAHEEIITNALLGMETCADAVMQQSTSWASHKRKYKWLYMMGFRMNVSISTVDSPRHQMNTRINNGLGGNVYWILWICCKKRVIFIDPSSAWFTKQSFQKAHKLFITSPNVSHMEQSPLGVACRGSWLFLLMHKLLPPDEKDPACDLILILMSKQAANIIKRHLTF